MRCGLFLHRQASFLSKWKSIRISRNLSNTLQHFQPFRIIQTNPYDDSSIFYIYSVCTYVWRAYGALPVHVLCIYCRTYTIRYVNLYYLYKCLPILAAASSSHHLIPLLVLVARAHLNARVYYVYSDSVALTLLHMCTHIYRVCMCAARARTIVCVCLYAHTVYLASLRCVRCGHTRLWASLALLCVYTCALVCVCVDILESSAHKLWKIKREEIQNRSYIYMCVCS